MNKSDPDKHAPVRVRSLNEWKKFRREDYPLDIRKYYSRRSRQQTLINKKTPIVSMGSCFAGHISKYLIKNNYNYIIKEESVEDIFSARWGLVVNPACIHQIFKYSLESFNPITDYWIKRSPHQKQENRTTYYQDPFRAGVLHEKNDYKKSIALHHTKSKKALLSAKVIILTLGLIEVWRDKRDLATFAKVPPTNNYNKKIHEFHLLTEDECYYYLTETYNLLKKHNPNCKLILTLSPIPLRATFRKDTDVVSASVYSKAILPAENNGYNNQRS